MGLLVLHLACDDNFESRKGVNVLNCMPFICFDVSQSRESSLAHVRARHRHQLGDGLG